MRIVEAAFSVVDGKQNANGEMATRSRDERERKKTKDEISGAGLRARIFGRERGRVENDCRKSAPARAAFSRRN